MKIDKHHDPYGDLESTLIQEIEGIARQLGGNIQKLTTCNSTGRQSKKIVIEYDIDETK